MILPKPEKCRHVRPGGSLLLAGCLLIAGCGVQAYEQQLKDANELFTYQNRLDQALNRTPWDAAGYGVSLRIPLGYGQIPAPVPVAMTEGDEAIEGEPSAESAEPPVDLRQPTYLGVPELEGLLGAWKATVPARDSGNAVVFLYVLGNHERMLNQSPSGGGAPPDQYFEDLETLLGLQFGVTVEKSSQATNDPNKQFPESLPREERFVRKKDFSVVRLVPTEGALQELQLPKLEAYLYEHQAGSIQAAILLVAPQSVRDNPDTALRIALETLSVSSQAPKRQADGQVGQPAGPAGF